MKTWIWIVVVFLSNIAFAQNGVPIQEKKGKGEYKYILNKDGVDSEEEIFSLVDVTMSEFYDAIKKISEESKAKGYEITSSFFSHIPYEQKSPKLGKYELELTIQKEDQEEQTLFYVFENTSYHEGSDKFKIHIDQLGEEGYIIKSYKVDFSAYEALEMKD